MSHAEPLTFNARATRYERQRGRDWDPHRMTLDQFTPAQRRRLMRKERRTWRKYADAHPYRDDWGGATDDLDDYGDHGERDYYYDDGQDPHDLGYCVTPGCNCCGDGDD